MQPVKLQMVSTIPIMMMLIPRRYQNIGAGCDTFNVLGGDIHCSSDTQQRGGCRRHLGSKWKKILVSLTKGGKDSHLLAKSNQQTDRQIVNKPNNKYSVKNGGSWGKFKNIANHAGKRKKMTRGLCTGSEANYGCAPHHYLSKSTE